MDNIEQILSVCSFIFRMAENVKANKERCQRVAQRAKALQELVLIIKQRGPGQISAAVENALRELSIALDEAKGIMIKFSQTKGVMSFLKSSSHEEKFFKMNERLTDNFQVLSGALQIEQGTILNKVYERVSGRSQDEEYYSGQAPTSPTSPMPLPGIMPHMPVSSPTTPLPSPSTMPPMQMPSPTTPMPLPGFMHPMQMPNPTTPMPLPGTMPPMQMPSPTTAMPPPGFMAPMQMPSPTTPMPLPSTMPPMQMSNRTIPMPLHGTMSPIRFSNTIASRPVLGTVSPIIMSSPMAPRPVSRIITPIRAPFAPMTQSTSVIRSYVVNNSYST